MSTPGKSHPGKTSTASRRASIGRDPQTMGRILRHCTDASNPSRLSPKSRRAEILFHRGSTWNISGSSVTSVRRSSLPRKR
ncbi:MAG: hypothetical protein KKE59_04530 [Proteobacteria bacterium]|nr:hypothetical protein [Pseudomonadota bacterium]